MKIIEGRGWRLRTPNRMPHGNSGGHVVVERAVRKGQQAGCWLSAVTTCREGTRRPRSCANGVGHLFGTAIG
jgi:hypothetical protein